MTWETNVCVTIPFAKLMRQKQGVACKITPTFSYLGEELLDLTKGGEGEKKDGDR